MKEHHTYLTVPYLPNVTVAAVPSTMVPLLNGQWRTVSIHETLLPWAIPSSHRPQPPQKAALNPGMVCGNSLLLLYRLVNPLALLG